MGGLSISLNEETLADQVFNHIRRLIVSQELKGGDRIPEAKIAGSFGVSRTPIREALRRLEQHGLVRIFPRSHAEVVSLDPGDADNLWELRILLERHAVSRFAAVASGEDIALLTDLTNRSLKAISDGDLATAFEFDNEYHMEIARRCGNGYVQDALERLSARFHLHRAMYCTDPDQIDSDIRLHFGVIKAIGDGNPGQAARLLGAHIERGKHQQPRQKDEGEVT